MSSTTTNLGLVKMASGETIGQWSDANNGSGANLDKIDTAIGNLNSHIAVLPSYTQCSNQSALETYLSSVASGMTDNQIQTVYIITGESFGFNVFGSGERYAGELKRMTSTQFVCSFASRLGDRVEVGYYDGTYTYSYLYPSNSSGTAYTLKTYTLNDTTSHNDTATATHNGFFVVRLASEAAALEIFVRASIKGVGYSNTYNIPAYFAEPIISIPCHAGDILQLSYKKQTGNDNATLVVQNNY